MNKQIIIIIICIATLFMACTKQWPEPTFQPGEGINIIIGDQFHFTDSDISHYDLSTGIFYLNNAIDFNDKDTPFLYYWIFSDGEVIYKGMAGDLRLNSYCGSTYFDSVMVVRQFQSTAFALNLERKTCWYSVEALRSYDPRKGEAFVSELKKHGKLKLGIDVVIDQLELINDTTVNASYTVSNLDNWDYYLLNPEIKTGNDLYDAEWKLVLMNGETDEFLYSKCQNIHIKHGEPWSPDWLMLLKSGESYSYSIAYTLCDTVKSSEYTAYFTYQNLGIEFANIEETFYNNGRILMGKSEYLQDVTIKR
jgi:hypothetical protein